MDEQKQKIISDICPFYKEYGTCEKCNEELPTDNELCYFECMANAIINYGYSKQTELELLKSTITHKEEQAYAKGYADAKADLLEKLQADIARDSVLAEYGDELFEGRIAGFKVVMNYLAESEQK